MNRLSTIVLGLGMATSLTLGVQGVESAKISSQSAAQQTPQQDIKVLREYKGVKLGLKREQVHAILGKPENSTGNIEDFKLSGNDSMTVHYENDEVKTIQLAFYDPKNAPAWNDVVGDAEVNETETGARHARQIISAEHFWVAIYQSKDGQTTRITISR